MRNFLKSSLAAVALLAAPAIAFADAGGIGIGATGGTYQATATSAANGGNVVILGNGGYTAQVGSTSFASNGMGIGASETISNTVDNSVAGVVTTSNTTSSVATLEGFGTAGSTSRVAVREQGIVLGQPAVQTNGSGNSAGAFLGIGIIAAVE